MWFYIIMLTLIGLLFKVFKRLTQFNGLVDEHSLHFGYPPVINQDVDV